MPNVVLAAGETYDVRDYGAVGDGAADDTAAIQRALDAAAANGGGVVTLPAGSYRITTLTVGGSGVVFQGEGDSSVLVGDASTAQSIIRIVGPYVLTGVQVRDMSIRGNYGRVGQIGVWTTNLKAGVVESVTVTDANFCGIYSNGVVEDCAFVGNTVEHCGDFGIHLNTESAARNLILDNNCRDFASLNYPAHGVYVKYATDTTVSGNTVADVVGSNNSGIEISHSTGSVVSQNVVSNALWGVAVVTGSRATSVTGNVISGIGRSGIDVYVDVVDTHIVSNTITDCGEHGVRLYGEYVRVSGVEVRDNQIKSALSGSVRSYCADDVAIEGNQLITSAGGSVYNLDVIDSSTVRVADNTITGGSRALVARYSGSGIVIDGNVIQPGITGLEYGVLVADTIEDATVIGNDLRAVTSGIPLSILAATSTVTDNLLPGAEAPTTTTTAAPTTTTLAPTTTTTQVSVTTGRTMSPRKLVKPVNRGRLVTSPTGAEQASDEVSVPTATRIMPESALAAGGATADDSPSSALGASTTTTAAPAPFLIPSLTCDEGCGPGDVRSLSETTESGLDSTAAIAEVEEPSSEVSAPCTLRVVAQSHFVNGLAVVSVAAPASTAVDKVVCWIDCWRIGPDLDGPFAFVWNTKWAEKGSAHTVTAVVYDSFGRELSRASVPLVVQ